MGKEEGGRGRGVGGKRDETRELLAGIFWLEGASFSWKGWLMGKGLIHWRLLGC